MNKIHSHKWHEYGDRYEAEIVTSPDRDYWFYTFTIRGGGKGNSLEACKEDIKTLAKALDGVREDLNRRGPTTSDCGG